MKSISHGVFNEALYVTSLRSTELKNSEEYFNYLQNIVMESNYEYQLRSHIQVGLYAKYFLKNENLSNKLLANIKESSIKTFRSYRDYLKVII